MMEFAMKTGNIRTLVTLNKMGAEVIPGLLESIRKATTERREYGNGKKALGGAK